MMYATAIPASELRLRLLMQHMILLKMANVYECQEVYKITT